MNKSQLDIHSKHGQVKLFFLLAVLGIIAALNHVHIPHTKVLIDGRWVFGFLGFALLRHWWAALALGALLSYPYGTDISFWVGFGGNMLYAVPSLLVIRPLSSRMQNRWGPDPRLWLGWSALVMACYQAFTTPAVWAVLALMEHRPVWLHVLEGWRTQPFFVESILVAFFSATAMVALVALEQLRAEQRRLAHINRVLLGIRNVNQLIVTEDDPKDLVTRACVNLTETMGYLNAWIALVGGEAGRALGLPPEKSVCATAAAGFDGGFATMQNEMECGKIPSCMKHALDRDEVIVTDNPSQHCFDCPLSSGYDMRTGFARRLHFSGMTYGILSATVPVGYAHDEEEQNLFDEVAGDIAFALHKIAMAKRMQESRRRYLEIFEHSRDGFVMVDPAGRIIDANPAFCEMLGYTLDELRALPDFYQITPERWREWESTEIWENRLMGRGYSGIYEKEYIRKDGTVFPVELRSYAIRRGKGEIEYLWGTARDITEFKTARDALRRQLHFERGVSAASTCLLTAHDGDRNITESLGCLCEAADVSRVYLFQNFHDDADGLCMGQTHEACAAGIVPQIDNLELQHAAYSDGFDRWREELAAGRHISGHVADFPEGEREILEPQEIVSILIIPVLVAGAWHGFVGFDETRQRREWLKEEVLLLRTAAEFLGGYLTRLKAEKDLKESEKKFRILVDQAADMLLVHDMEGRIIDVNQASVAGYGYSREELLSMKVAALDPDYVERENSGRFWDRFEMNETFRFEARQKRKDGTTFPVEVSITKLMINEQHAIMGLCRDISDRKKAEKEREKIHARLQQAQKMEAIGALAGGIAHDFNNILFPIVGMSELLLEDIPFDRPEHEKVQEILTAGKRGGALVKQILAFSRQSEGKKMPVRIQQVVQEVIKMVRATIPANINISHHLQRDCGPVMAEPTQVHQVAMNLITNAYHAVDPANGKISIRLKEVVLDAGTLAGRDIEGGAYALLIVSDNGCGISPGNMEKIFEPYFTTKEQDKGTGIGLSTVYGIVKEHGGDIQAYSELGKGTTFNIYLPLMVKAPDAVYKNLCEISPSGKERILLVDDEAAIARLEKQMLERLGYRVASRVSSIEALEAFKASPRSYDLVITDMSMPNMTGDRLARELIAIRPDIPVIMCTGFSDQINADRAKQIGIKDFLMKPVVKTEMAKTVRKVLDEKKPENQC